jgi:acetyl-CoA C-acetyltransferase
MSRCYFHITLDINRNQKEWPMGQKNVAIIGIGEVPTGIYPERSRWDIIYETCIQAVRDAGIHKNDVEGVITVAP